MEYLFYIKNHGGVPVIVESEKDFSLDIEKIYGAITEKTKAILLNSPNNPTGVIYSENLCASWPIRFMSGKTHCRRISAYYPMSLMSR